ncbi:MAG: hypothetical protein M3P22_02760, partial [bacterium]|nr:hypothetical protein [bacterium]
NTAGRIAARASRSKGAMSYSKEKLELDKWNKGPKNTPKPTIGKYTAWEKFGGNINYSQKKVGETEHARHELEDYKKKIGREGVSDGNLSGTDIDNMETKFKTEKKGDFESMVRRGTDGKNDVELIDPNTGNKTGLKGEAEFKAQRREELQKDLLDPANLATSIANRDVEYDTIQNKNIITNQGREKIRDQLDVEFNAILKVSTEELSKKKFDHLKDEAAQDISIGKRLSAGSTGGSYDARQIGPKFSLKDNFLKTGALVGLTAAVAYGIRSGMKTANMNPGAGKGDFMTDMGNIISAGLKGAKINIASGHATPEKGGGDHSGGNH